MACTRLASRGNTTYTQQSLSMKPTVPVRPNTVPKPQPKPRLSLKKRLAVENPPSGQNTQTVSLPLRTPRQERPAQGMPLTSSQSASPSERSSLADQSTLPSSSCSAYGGSPGEIGRQRSEAKTSTPRGSHSSLPLDYLSVSRPSSLEISTRQGQVFYRSDSKSRGTGASNTLSESGGYQMWPSSPGTAHSTPQQDHRKRLSYHPQPTPEITPGPPVFQGSPEITPVSPTFQEWQQRRIDRTSPQKDARKRISYHPQPTPDLTPSPPPTGPPRRRLVPDKRFSQMSDESTLIQAEQDDYTVDTKSAQDRSRLNQSRSRSTTPPICRMRSSMFGSGDLSTLSIDPSLSWDGDSSVYQTARSSLPSSRSNTTFYTPTTSTLPTIDEQVTLRPRKERRVRQGDPRRFGIVFPTPIAEDRESYFADSEDQNSTTTSTRSTCSQLGTLSSEGDTSNVFPLNSKTFQSFLSQQHVAAVMFYNSTTNMAGVVEDWAKQYIPQGGNKAYATVDCAEEPQLCDRENVADLPYFKIYSKGFSVMEAKDFSKIRRRMI